MKKEIIKLWDGFRNWVHYVLDYKNNKDNDLIYSENEIAYRKQIKRLKNDISKRIELAKEKDNLMELREQKIEHLTTRLSEAKQDNISKQNIIYILNEQLDAAEETIEKKVLIIKQLNMRYAQSQRKLQKLEKDIQRKDHKIKFLLASKEAPSKEKIMAYEKCMKEVEKRQKEKNK